MVRGSTAIRDELVSRGPRFTASIVVPAYNEADNIPLLLDRIVEKTSDVPAIEIIVVDDGSSDDSAAVLRAMRARHAQVRFILLSRNYGHQGALRAGIQHARGDCVICMDADLQHPPQILPEMIRLWLDGADIVTGIRRESTSLSWFKRASSRWFYRALNWTSGLGLVPGSSDFRLLDRKVVSVLNQLPESDLFFRGIVPMLGFKTVAIGYDPADRHHGDSKYTFRKMVRLALNGVISTSTRPLRLATYFAFMTALSAMSFLGYVLYVSLVRQSSVPGWASTLAVVLIIGTMQLLVLGVIGEYLGQTLKETRRRPPYVVAETGGFADQSQSDGNGADDTRE